MHKLPRTILAGLAALSLTGGLAACGGDDLSSKSAEEVLKETFGPDKPVRSGKVDLTFAFDAKGLQGANGPIRIEVRGPFASQEKGGLPRFDFDLDLDVAGQPVKAGAVSTGDKGFLKFAGQTFDIGPELFTQFKTLYERDQKEAAKDDNPTFQALGVDPSRWLLEPEKAEDETVGGAETIHVSSKVDVPKLLEDVNRLLGRADATGAGAAAGAAGRNVPSQLTAEQRKTIERSVKETSLDVFTGKEDGTLRRLNINVTFDVPADARQSAGGLTTGKLGLDLVISDLNEEQAIKAPAGARPLSDLTAATGGGGATGATGPQADGGTPAPAPAPAPAPLDPNSPEGKYQECLAKAGGSISELQKCQPLLSGQ